MFFSFHWSTHGFLCTYLQCQSSLSWSESNVERGKKVFISMNIEWNENVGSMIIVVMIHSITGLLGLYTMHHVTYSTPLYVPSPSQSYNIQQSNLYALTNDIFIHCPLIPLISIALLYYYWIIIFHYEQYNDISLSITIHIVQHIPYSDFLTYLICF